MLTIPGSDIPMRVQGQVRPDEMTVTTLLGQRGSGLLLTDRRLYAWREDGIAASLPLGAIEHIVIDDDASGQYHHIIVLPRQPFHAGLLLTRRRRALSETLALVTHLAATMGVRPREERFGTVQRISFPKVLSE
jgi:hypothetical protein